MAGRSAGAKGAGPHGRCEGGAVGAGGSESRTRRPQPAAPGRTGEGTANPNQAGARTSLWWTAGAGEVIAAASIESQESRQHGQ